MRSQALQDLDLNASQISNLVVTSKLRAGTNLIEITVSSTDPGLASAIANKIGELTAKVADKLYGVYNLNLLDKAEIPKVPIRPRIILNLGLGGGLGIILAIGIAFLVEFLKTPMENNNDVTGILDYRSGVYNQDYLLQRLSQEMSRSKRHHYALTLAIIDIDQHDLIEKSIPKKYQDKALYEVGKFLKHYLREEDILARLERTTFCLLLPDMVKENAMVFVNHIQKSISLASYNKIESGEVTLNLSGVVTLNLSGEDTLNLSGEDTLNLSGEDTLNLTCIISLISYDYNYYGTPEEYLNKAKLALKEAEKSQIRS
jgi:diguanylate cyclase (GGDEF)-like protein